MIQSINQRTDEFVGIVARFVAKTALYHSVRTPTTWPNFAWRPARRSALVSPTITADEGEMQIHYRWANRRVFMFVLVPALGIQSANFKLKRSWTSFCRKHKHQQFGKRRSDLGQPQFPHWNWCEYFPCDDNYVIMLSSDWRNIIDDKTSLTSR